VLYALGNGNAGLSLFVQGDRLVFDYNAFGDHTVVESTATVPAGESCIGVRFRREGNGAVATLVIDDRECGAADIPFAMRVVSSVGSSVGYDHGRPVSDRYDDTFPFEGALCSLDIELVSTKRTEEREVAAAEERTGMARQ
jgi:arylsulfatase